MAMNADLSQSQIDSMLNEFDTKLTNLRMAYDRYFNGADRRPPVFLRTEVVRMMHELEHKTFIQNTAQRFRLRALVQRFNTHKTYWDRILRQIEEGTYKKHLDKAKRNMEQRARFDARRAEEEQQQQQAIELDFDFDAVESLDSFASQLNQMDQQGHFDQPARQPAPQPQQPSAAPFSPTAVNHQQPSMEDRRAAKIAEIQRKLGLQGQSPQPQAAPQQPQRQPVQQQPVQKAEDKEEQRRRKLEEMKRRLEARSTTGASTNKPAAQGAPTRASQVQRASQQRPQHAQSHQQPNKQDQVERVYRNLVEAKRRCNEPTGALTRDAVARSMQQQRAKFKQSHGSDNVDFKVVIKNGKAFLKPEPK